MPDLNIDLVQDDIVEAHVKNSQKALLDAIFFFRGMRYRFTRLIRNLWGRFFLLGSKTDQQTGITRHSQLPEVNRQTSK